MKKYLLCLVLINSILIQACAQGNKKEKAQIKVGAPCEGCESVFESPIPFEKLNWVDTLPDFNDPGPKLILSGVIYKSDGKTPAKDVVLYIYHTDQTGVYPTKGNEKGWGKRHGYLRGWIKTNEKGEYKFYTLKPAAYPGRRDPAHIHPIVKEPDKTEYWIDEYLFDDDPLLTADQRKRQVQVGGPGILKLENRNGVFYATRDIILGRNVQNYPSASVDKLNSGLAIGSNCPAFDPKHVSGADKGKTACPMCKYGYQQGIMVWINETNMDGIKNFAKSLETEMQKRGEKKLRVFLIHMNPTNKDLRSLESELINWAATQDLKKVALVYIPTPNDPESSELFQINTSPEIKNTVFVYKKRRVAAKWVNIDYDEASLNTILKKFS